MTLTTRASLALATALFFVSGALGLGYQLVWIRKAALIVGASQIALATVLTSFFLGLGLGSLAVARHLKSRRLSPLFVYGLFEAAIGLFALIFPTLFGLVEGAYAGLYPIFANQPVGLFALRFALIFGLFVVPTFFMGGTLPLLLDGLVRRDESVGSLTSFLYGTNILGAVAGVLATAYFAIPVLGMNGTSLAAGVGNLSIAAVALAVFRRVPAPPAPAAAAVRRLSAFYASLGFASGFAAIGYQVLWARYFSLFHYSSVYLTAILLAVYLSALAAGSMLLAPLFHRFQERVHPLRIVATVQPLVAVLVFLTLSWWRLAAYETGLVEGLEVAPSWRLFGPAVDAIFAAPLAQVALVIFLPVTLIGAVLPSLIVAAAPRHETLRSATGSLAFWNTLGASAGGFAAGYLLIPGFGLTGAFLCLAVVSIAVGAAAEWKYLRLRRAASAAEAAQSAPRFRFRAGGVVPIVALAAALLLARADITENAIRNYGVGAKVPNLQLTEVVEGPLATAFVLDGGLRIIASGNQVLAMVTHGHVSTQAIQGHIPALFYPKAGSPERALGIALGSGQSFGALLRYPLTHMDIVDISGEMIELSLRHFEDVNNGLEWDPRVEFHLDDGRHFVDRAPDASYDVVSMEPPPPTADGVHTLYSSEFYEGVERILRDGGVLMQWLPLYLVTPGELRGIVATQAAVFPQSFVVMVGHMDFMIVSFKQDSPPRFSLEWLAERARIYATEPNIRSRWNGANRFTLPTVPGILSLILTGPEDIARMDASVVYHDDDLRLSYSSGDQELRRFRESAVTAARLSFAALPLTPFADLQRYFEEPLPAAVLDRERAIALQAFNVPPPAELASEVEQYSRAPEGAARADLALAIALRHGKALAVPETLRWIGRAVAAFPEDQRDAQLGAVRQLVRVLRPVYADEIRQWIEALPEPQQAAPVVQAMGGELVR